MRFLKKGLALLLGLSIMLCAVPSLATEELLPASVQMVASAPAFTDSLPAKSYILIEPTTGQVLAENNADEKMPPASITKIMTLLLLMERIDSGEISYDDIVTGSEHANSMGGTQIWLEVGEQMTVRDLLKATAINSANDAAVALAEYMAGTEEAFVNLMNQKAQELGMTSTTFKNASGLDADGHLSTARDIAIMSAELLKHPAITEYTSTYMDSLRNGETELVNTNKLVRFYDGCNGIKTGTTDGAGSCLSASAQRDGMNLIAVTMGSSTSKERFASARALLDYGFATYTLYTPEITEDELAPVPVKNAQKNTVPITLGEKSALVLPKGTAANIEHQITLDEDLTAPIKKGTQVGEVTYTLNGEAVAQQPIYTAEEVKEKGFGFVFLSLLKSFFGIA